MDHFENPRNVGEIENASGVGTVGNAKCGDIMRIYLDIEENQIIRDVKFKTCGCGAAVATSSMATELVKGKNIKEAMRVTNKAVTVSYTHLDVYKRQSGGYVLNKKAEEISVGDVLRALEGSLEQVKCAAFYSEDGCISADSCVTKYVWKKINESINETVNKIMLDELVGESKKRNPAGGFDASACGSV